VTLVDTSVVVAAYATWHRHHLAAHSLVDGSAQIVAHCAVEAFSVLTRLPAPHRVAPNLVRDFLSARFPEPYVGLDGAEYHRLIPRLVELGISGGATCDALVAATARAANQTLLSCDRRAADTYARIGVEFRLIG
jgi:predicted nucleic acid-binding protein